MGPAGGEGDAAVTAFGKRWIGRVAVALHGAAEVGGDDVIKARCGSAGGPGVGGVGSGSFAGPEVALLGLAVAGAQILDGCLVDLHIASGHDAGVDVLINRSQPIGGQSEPARHALPWDGDVVPGGVDLLLPVEREVIAILRDDDLCEQPWCGDAALLERVERGDDGGLVRLVTLQILFADDAAAEEPRGLIVELLGDLFADAPPGFGRCGDFLRLDDFIDGGQVLGHACFALSAWLHGLVVLVTLVDLSLQDAGVCAGGFGFFCAVISDLQKQHELAVIDLFAAPAKYASDEQVHLFAQQFVLRTQRRDFLGESGFQRCHHGDMMQSRWRTN